MWQPIKCNLWPGCIHSYYLSCSAFPNWLTLVESIKITRGVYRWDFKVGRSWWMIYIYIYMYPGAMQRRVNKRHIVCVTGQILENYLLQRIPFKFMKWPRVKAHSPPKAQSARTRLAQYFRGPEWYSPWCLVTTSLGPAHSSLFWRSPVPSSRHDGADSTYTGSMKTSGILVPSLQLREEEKRGKNGHSKDDRTEW